MQPKSFQVRSISIHFYGSTVNEALSTGLQRIIEADFVPTPGESIRLPKLLGSSGIGCRRGSRRGYRKLL